MKQLNSSDLEAAITASRKLVAAIYDPTDRYKKHHQDLSKLHFELVGKDTPLHKLPPSEYSFEQHVKRASYQTKIWLCSHQAKPNIASPEGNGWHKVDNAWRPKMLDCQTTPELLDDLLCSC